jgi:hypothetical protein
MTLLGETPDGEKTENDYCAAIHEGVDFFVPGRVQALGRPNSTPRARARLRPSLVRATIRCRSNSASRARPAIC